MEKVKDESEKKIETRELKDKVLSHLEERNPEWKENWETCDRAVKRR